MEGRGAGEEAAHGGGGGEAAVHGHGDGKACGGWEGLGVVEVLAAFSGLGVHNEIRVNGPRVITRY